ncbi:aminobenzoyl-glutamate utilization protein [Acetobacter nitrogenifigens DSM 23921 = NBRC 105050]|uniref:Peptidase M20 n=1 Tax=Acetobacter nitrogenifigens DSM 23921 = NBRC 105050 TaxID=1120919 RepID=A0A511XCX1_9PROT|nr:M20 family metallopeptidase [Acetobacter nitrogenifigens]GBQ91624.1 aminobenzoyl-glutamate utilization protein [Acetobacter nitrogenifigens DSM 23921 = NBRC 105050]GEN60814.1 peptidase M20 [Acetobacter nitrogenifigens DSM 23921 = NBRC 105050]
MRNSDEVWSRIDELGPAFCDLSDRIWDQPELAYGEFAAVAEHAAMLEQQGFKVTRDVAGIPTAVTGEFGEEGPVIAILGEYDALPGLSQEAGVSSPSPLPGAGFGHGCGHNLLGSSAMLAATAVKDYLKAHGVKGRVRYYGCPAEEGGAAKTFMVREGAFDDVDIAISWHPSSFSGVNAPRSLANTRIDFTFTGKASHAAAAPHLGRSALDAAELMNIGANYLREHMPQSARLHYAYIDAGGVAPNVVQSKVTIRYLIRSETLPELRDLIERVRKIAAGAAMMTETQVSEAVVSAVSNLMGNTPLEQAMHRNFERLGAPQFDDVDRAVASEFVATLTKADRLAAYNRMGIPYDPDAVLCDLIAPPCAEGDGSAGSTDVGDVSWAVPTVQARGATCAIGTQLHSWQMTGQGKTAHAHKGMIHTAKIMAATALDAILDENLLTKAKAEHASTMAVTPYICPMPDSVKPPLRKAPEAA